MATPPHLTKDQREALALLEPRLRDAARRGEYAAARRYAAQIQGLLRPTGHETRLQKAKAWLFEAALEAGELRTAIAGFEGIRMKVKKTTRVYLEATVLLAITYLRAREREAAEPLIREALTLERNITSERKRTQFRVRIVKRLEAEYLLALLADASLPTLLPEEIQREAGRLLMSLNEDEILAYLGDHMPGNEVEEALQLYASSRKLLPPRQQRLLPSPSAKKNGRATGTTVWAAARRVIWRALCDPENDIYKMWFDKGLRPAADYKIIAAAVAAALAGAQIGYFALAAAGTAFVVKFGVEVFCENTKDPGIMIAPHE